MEAIYWYRVGLGEQHQAQEDPNTMAGTEDVMSDPHDGGVLRWQVAQAPRSWTQAQAGLTSVLGWDMLRLGRRT